MTAQEMTAQEMTAQEMTVQERVVVDPQIITALLQIDSDTVRIEDVSQEVQVMKTVIDARVDYMETLIICSIVPELILTD